MTEQESEMPSKKGATNHILVSILGFAVIKSVAATQCYYYSMRAAIDNM